MRWAIPKRQKQNGELRGFVRLSNRLKTLYPRLPILLGGLYANGLVMQRCLRANWQLMIVLQDKDLSTLWQELRALHTLKVTSFAALLGKAPTALHLGQRHRLGRWFERASAAPSCTGVGCEKSWETIDEQARSEIKVSRHACWQQREDLSGFVANDWVRLFSATIFVPSFGQFDPVFRSPSPEFIPFGY